MRKSYLFYKLVFAGALAMVTAQSCKKENGIDNDTVVKKPYALYVSDMEGQLLNTTDGVRFKTMFPTDGYPSRSLITSGPKNVLWFKANLHVSTNEGENFNLSYQYVQDVGCPGLEYSPWQQVMIDVPSHKRVYATSALGRGIVYSTNHGVTWTEDGDWDTSLRGGFVTSFAQLNGGALFAHSVVTNDIYVRFNDMYHTPLGQWNRLIRGNNYPPGGGSYLTAFNNTLVMTDMCGSNGIYHTSDTGRNWHKFDGLPAGTKLFATNAPFGQHLLVGTESMGIYRLENGRFVASNSGLDDYTTVYAIVGKGNVYKNETVKDYVYIATNKGLYRSDDYGRNWYLVLPGSFVSLY